MKQWEKDLMDFLGREKKQEGNNKNWDSKHDDLLEAIINNCPHCDSSMDEDKAYWNEKFIICSECGEKSYFKTWLEEVE